MQFKGRTQKRYKQVFERINANIFLILLGGTLKVWLKGLAAAGIARKTRTKTEDLIYICSMLKLFYTRLPEKFDGGFLERMRERVLPEVRDEVALCRNRSVVSRRLTGEIMVGEAIRQCWGLERSAYSIVRPQGGKPYVEKRKGIFFNVSHSGDYVVCAVSDQDLGVDIERRGKARLGVARRFFHPEELACLERLPEDGRDRRFFDYWSVKEAFLKYVGTGVARPLNSFRVEFSHDKIGVFEGDALLPVCVRECPVDGEYACYLCSESGEPVEWQEFALWRE